MLAIFASSAAAHSIRFSAGILLPLLAGIGQIQSCWGPLCGDDPATGAARECLLALLWQGDQGQAIASDLLAFEMKLLQRAFAGPLWAAAILFFLAWALRASGTAEGADVILWLPLLVAVLDVVEIQIWASQLRSSEVYGCINRSAAVVGCSAGLIKIVLTVVLLLALGVAGGRGLWLNVTREPCPLDSDDDPEARRHEAGDSQSFAGSRQRRRGRRHRRRRSRHNIHRGNAWLPAWTSTLSRVSEDVNEDLDSSDETPEETLNEEEQSEEAPKEPSAPMPPASTEPSPFFPWGVVPVATPALPFSAGAHMPTVHNVAATRGNQFRT